MVVRRRNWLYRLNGRHFAESVSFHKPVTAAEARAMLKRSAGNPLELWGRDQAASSLRR